MPLIKRYSNRKFYNTETKEYITLGVIAGLIRRGEDVRIIDYASGQDLTALILSQVLFEQVKQQVSILPEAILTRLIQVGGGQNAVEPLSWSSSDIEGALGRVLEARGFVTRSEVQALIEKVDELIARMEEMRRQE